MASASLSLKPPGAATQGRDATATANKAVDKAAGDQNPAEGPHPPALDHWSKGLVGATHLAQRSSILSPQFWLSRGSATNQNMLLFRTLNPQLGLPNHNQDVLAECFRDELMPRRSFCIKKFKGHAAYVKGCVQHPHLGVPGIVDFVDARTKWVDEQVQKALDSSIPQVVVVAAGYDSRAYRFGNEAMHFYEVDLPAASKSKKKLVEKLLPEEQRKHVSWVAADLSTVSLNEALQGHTPFDAEQPALFTVEGLLYYLEPQAVCNLFQSISRLAAPGSLLCFDFLHADALLGNKEYVGFKACAQLVANKGEPWRSGLIPSKQALHAFLGHHAFDLTHVLDAQQLCQWMLPHLEWSNSSPSIVPFFSYVCAEKADSSFIV